MGCLLFTACGGDDPEEITPSGVGKQYMETYNIPTEGCNVSYTLNKLNTQIASIGATTDWLAVSPQGYSSGSPSIKIIAEANTNKSERKCTLSIIAMNGDKLTLTLV